MRRLVSVIVAGVLALGVLSVPPASAATSWGAPIWRDEFAGSSVKADWYLRNDTYGGGNNEEHRYLPRNAVVGNGFLRILTKRETVGTRKYTSAFLDTRDKGKYFPLYGRFEVRARLPLGQGVLPAFWLRRANGGASKAEVDILESFFAHKPGYGKFTLHFPETLGHNVTQQYARFSDAFHIWAIEITPAGDPKTGPVNFSWFLDGARVGFYQLKDPATIKKLHEPPADAAWDIALNTAVGGNWVGRPDSQLGYLPLVNRCSKNEKPPVNGYCDTAGLYFVRLPAVFQIDYVRVYSRKF